MQDEILNKSFQTKKNTTKEIIETNETNEMQTNLQKLHIQRKYGKFIIKMQFVAFCVCK
jgi:hypothetical protein